MIIFDLDGTLADCSHRRHFVDPSKNPHCVRQFHFAEGDLHHKFYDRQTKELFKPDWKAFYEACDKDEPIHETIRVFTTLRADIQIWSGRCESVKEKTIDWLMKYIPYHAPRIWYEKNLKMRPIGDYTPDDQLKERWLDEYLNKPLYPPLKLDMPEGIVYHRNEPISMVFDDRPKVLRMWQRRGVFTFDVGQGRGEF